MDHHPGRLIFVRERSFRRVTMGDVASNTVTNTAWQTFLEPDADTVPFTGVGRTRGSFIALSAFFFAVVGLGATLTGLLAWPGVVLGGLAALLALIGLITGGRPRRTGRGVALLALLFGVGAVVLGVLAIGGHLSWLSQHVDEVQRVRTWLDAHVRWPHWF